MKEFFKKLISFLKILLLWSLAFAITIGAAIYQRTTGPTYPKKVTVEANNEEYEVNLVRSLDLGKPLRVKLKIYDSTVVAKLYYKRFKTNDEYQVIPFSYKVYPVNSVLMNRFFEITEEKGFFADVPPQPPAGKLQYYIGLEDSDGLKYFLKDSPIVIRFKGSVPDYALIPHIIFMFLAMLFSTAAGIMSLTGYKSYKKYALYTLILLIGGGMILGPVVQKFAFGEFWTGIPFGWDLTDNKTLIALLFWILAVVMNRKYNKPGYTALAAFILLIIFSIPHSMFGSELDYASGQVTQGIIMLFLYRKNS
jgi:hypothetical protein